MGFKFNIIIYFIGNVITIKSIGNSGDWFFRMVMSIILCAYNIVQIFFFSRLIYYSLCVCVCVFLVFLSLWLNMEEKYN